MKREIRKSIPADLQVIAGFQVEMARETEGIELGETILYKGIKAVFDDPGKGQYYVCMIDGIIIASLMITFEWSDWRNGNVWWIQSVYVMQEYRKSGIFKAMFHYLQEIVEKDPAIRGLRLYVDRRNAVAQKVYTAIGMDGDHYQVFEHMK